MGEDDHGGQEIDSARGLARYITATSIGYDLDTLPSEVQGLLIKAATVLLKGQGAWDVTTDTHEVTGR